MEVDKSEYELIQQALSEWEQAGKLTRGQAEELKNENHCHKTTTPCGSIAQYFFFIALFCLLMAFGAIFINEKFIEKLKVYFSLSDLIIYPRYCGLIGAAVVLVCGQKKKLH